METTPEKRTLDEETRNKIKFITFIIPEFARAYKMDNQEAYFYLKKYGGLDYLFKCCWALHTDNPFSQYEVAVITEVCDESISR